MTISLKAARVNAGLTQAKAAEALETTKNTIASYENGSTIPKIDMAKKMAKLYGRSVDEIDFC